MLWPLTILLAALVSPLAAETASRATFQHPYEGRSDLAGWPLWSRIEVKTRAEAGNPEGLAHGDLSATWFLQIEPGGFFLGDAPVMADINGDGRDDMVVIQRLPKEGWRLLVVDLPLSGAEYLAQAYFAHKPELLVLHGAADLDGDDVPEIALSGRFDGVEYLLFNRWQDGQLVQAGPFQGFGPGPGEGGERMRFCDGGAAVLAAYGDPAIVVGVTAGDGPDQIDYAQLAASAEAAGFAAARACP